MRTTSVLVLLVCSLLNAQDDTTHKTNSESALTKLPVVRMDDGSILGLGPIYSHGNGFWLAATDKTSILVGSEDNGEGFVLAIAIRNDTTGMYTFDPTRIEAYDLVAAKLLKYLSPSAVAKRVTNQGIWARFTQGASRGASLAAQESYVQETTTYSGNLSGQTSAGTVQGTYSGTGTSSGKSECDAGCADAKARLMERFARQDAAQQQKAKLVEQTGLLRETLLPGNQVMGYVYFSKPKNGRVKTASGKQLPRSIDVSVTVPVEGETFRFYFPTELFDRQ